MGLRQARTAGEEIERGRHRDRLETRLGALEEASALISQIRSKATIVDTVAVAELQRRLVIVKARGHLVDDVSVIDELVDHPFHGLASGSKSWGYVTSA